VNAIEKALILTPKAQLLPQPAVDGT